MKLHELRLRMREGAVRMICETDNPERLGAFLQGVREFSPRLADALPDAATMLTLRRDERRAAYLAALREAGLSGPEGAQHEH